MNFLIIIILFQSFLVFAQTIPRDYYSYQSRKFLYDTGKDWESLTIFGPIRFKSKSERGLNTLNSGNYFDGQIGFDAGNEFYSLYGSGHFKYKNHYYGYLYPTFINKTDESHQPDIRTNIINNPYDQSGIGFENNWAILQIGRGKESWGSGNDIELAFSENSATYDYFLLASDYGKVRVRYVHGFLENVKTNINRYITARGFEWTNKRSLIIGFSETVIYSGENRSIDIGYLNPMSSHLEIELNNRLNIIGDENSNAVWQIHLDYLLKKNFRVSLNYLYDEFVFDPDIQIGKEHGKAYSIRLAYTPLFSNHHLITLFSSLVYVGTPTFRHGIGTNNFVQNGRPLGWYGGSDGREICVGMKYFNNKDLIINISSGLLQSGEETIVNKIFETYTDYLEGPFPSGEVKNTYFFETNVIYWFKENHSLSSSLNWSENVKIFNLKLNLPIFK
tara:strand:+ start:1138 stop:2478 length:1341 start_codon:yes stop_codon:yes gene_type:complete